MNEAAIEQVCTVLDLFPAGLITDVDGTLSPIALTPEAATISAQIRSSLIVLTTRLALVAAVSGRAASDVASLVGVPEMVFVGNHGLEYWQDGVTELEPEVRSYLSSIETIVDAASSCIKIPGVRWENKGASASVHYRLAPDPLKAERDLAVVLTPLVAKAGLYLTSGRMVWEIRPPLAIDKGSAVRNLVESYCLRGAIFLGDDHTDVDAFRVLHDLRTTGRCMTLAIGVIGSDTPRDVLDTADLLVDGVPAVAELLDLLAS